MIARPTPLRMAAQPTREDVEEMIVGRVRMLQCLGFDGGLRYLRVGPHLFSAFDRHFQEPSNLDRKEAALVFLQSVPRGKIPGQRKNIAH